MIPPRVSLSVAMMNRTIKPIKAHRRMNSVILIIETFSTTELLSHTSALIAKVA